MVLLNFGVLLFGEWCGNSICKKWDDLIFIKFFVMINVTKFILKISMDFGVIAKL